MTNWLAGMKITAARLNSPPGATSLGTGSVTNTVTETVIGTLTIPANPAGNQGYQFNILGTNDNAAGGGTVTFRLRIGANGTIADQSLITYGALTVQGSLLTQLPWSIAGWLEVVTAGSSGSTIATCGLTEVIVSSSSAWHPGVTQLVTSVNWTVTTFLTVTATWSAASSSSTTRTIDGGIAPTI